MREQLERHRVCRQNLDSASQQLREQENSLAVASEVSTGLCCSEGPPTLWVILLYLLSKERK